MKGRSPLSIRSDGVARRGEGEGGPRLRHFEKGKEGRREKAMTEENGVSRRNGGRSG